MVELAGEFLAERLSSRQLLALLYVCECRRRQTLANLTFNEGAKPPAWAEFVERFAARLAKLPETERVYLIGSHLQSAEEVAIYCNEEIAGLMEQHWDLIDVLSTEYVLLRRHPSISSSQALKLLSPRGCCCSQSTARSLGARLEGTCGFNQGELPARDDPARLLLMLLRSHVGKSWEIEWIGSGQLTQAVIGRGVRIGQMGVSGLDSAISSVYEHHDV